MFAPSGWDGVAPLPTLVFFHGWRESAEFVVADAPLKAFVERKRVLLIAPHGEGNTWSYPGAPGRHRGGVYRQSDIRRDWVLWHTKKRPQTRARHGLGDQRPPMRRLRQAPLAAPLHA